MRYWDASAMVSLLVREKDSARRVEQLRQDSDMITWWATGVECASALNRLHRDGQLDEESLRRALSDLHTLAETWVEVAPTETVRSRALRLLRVHPLRAADSLQLAALLVAAAENPAKLALVCADTRLSSAAEKEGFVVLA